MNLNSVRNFLFESLHGFQGYPVALGKDVFRLDASLRRWNADCESHIREAICDHLQPGDAAVDIGANFGMHTLVAARRVGEKGCVIAFEPVPHHLTLLKRHVKLNGFESQIKVEASAVSNSAETIINMDLPSNDLNLVASISDGESSRSIKVPNTRLDSYSLFDECRPELIKIDVEGAELEVIRSGENALRALKPKIVLEVHPVVDRTKLEELLKELGYQWEFLGENRPNEGREYHLLCV